MTVLTLVLVIVGAASQGEESRPWMLSGEGGFAAIHGSSRGGPFLGMRLHRALWEDRLRLETAGLASTADEGFGVLEAGLAIRTCSGPCKAAAYVGAGAGRLREPEFGGWEFRLCGGLELRLTKRNVLRFGAQWGTHGGRSGPYLFGVGFGRRFGGFR